MPTQRSESDAATEPEADDAEDGNVRSAIAGARRRRGRPGRRRHSHWPGPVRRPDHRDRSLTRRGAARARRRVAGRARALPGGPTGGRARHPALHRPRRGRGAGGDPGRRHLHLRRAGVAHRRLDPGVRRRRASRSTPTATSEDEVVTADLPDELADGTYVVAWRVVSADGHPISGSLTFSIGAPSETVVPPHVDSESTAGTKADLGHRPGARLRRAPGGRGAGRLLRLDGRRRPARRRRPSPGCAGCSWSATGVAVGAAALGVPLAGRLPAGPRHGRTHRPGGVRPRPGGRRRAGARAAGRGPVRGFAAPRAGGCWRPPRPRSPSGRRPWSGHTRALRAGAAAGRHRRAAPQRRRRPGWAAWSGWRSRCRRSAAGAGTRSRWSPGSPRWPPAVLALLAASGTRDGLADPRLVGRAVRHDVRAAAAGEGRHRPRRRGDRRLEPVPAAARGCPTRSGTTKA